MLQPTRREPATSRVESPWLSRSEASQRARCSESTVDRAVRSGALRAGGTFGRVLIKQEWLDEWLERRGR
jgi:excisionase family DNA binding protein